MTDRRTRVALFPVALLLWLAAAVARLGRSLDCGGTDESPAVILACCAVLACYVGFVGWMHATDQQWTLGWRR